MVGPLASSTHEAPLLRESGEQDQHQENGPHVHDSHLSQPQLTLTDYAGNKSHLSLSQQLIVGHKVRPAIAKDSPKRPGTKGIKSPSQIPGQSSSLKSAEQDWKHQGPEDSDFRPPAQVPEAPHPMIQ